MHGAALIIRFRFPTCHAFIFITWFELSRVKLSRNVLKGNKNYLELAGVFLHYSKCETEIQGKSTLVRVSARFELARVRVIGSQPHPLPKFYFNSIIIFNLHKTKVSSTAVYE